VVGLRHFRFALCRQAQW